MIFQIDFFLVCPSKNFTISTIYYTYDLPILITKEKSGSQKFTVVQLQSFWSNVSATCLSDTFSIQLSLPMLFSLPLTLMAENLFFWHCLHWKLHWSSMRLVLKLLFESYGIFLIPSLLPPPSSSLLLRSSRRFCLSCMFTFDFERPFKLQHSLGKIFKNILGKQGEKLELENRQNRQFLTKLRRP